MANIRVEIKVKQKKKKYDKVEYIGSNRMRYIHWLTDGVTKIYVSDHSLSIAEDKLKEMGLEYEIKKDKE